MSSFFDKPQPIAFAHRGGDERYPENTLAAFKDAYKLGYRYFETDVHYTVDHELVAFHDDNLSRVLGLKHSIEKMTKAERKSLLIDNKYPIPLFSELLEAFPDVWFNVDAKNRSAIAPLIATLKKYKALDRVCLASFSTRSIRELRRLVPGVPTIATNFEIAGLKIDAIRKRVREAQTKYLEIPEHFFYDKRRVRLLNKKFIDSLHESGHKVFVWTINDRKTMERLLDMGVDGIFTDRARLLRDVLKDRGEWSS